MKIKVYHITFQQSDLDTNEIANYFNIADWRDVDDNDLFEYLMQWHQDDLDKYNFSIYEADQIDTEFLGYRWDRRKTKSGYLFSRNDRMGYCGLSYFKLI